MPVSFHCYLQFQDTLFPYVTENLESFLTTRYEEEETKNDIEALRSLVSLMVSA